MCRKIVFYISIVVLYAIPVLSQDRFNVRLTRSGNTIKISNGLLGIVIPSEQAFIKGQPCPAPIQSFIYNDGLLSNDRLNELTFRGSLSGMKVNILKSSPEQVTAKIEYTFIKEEFIYGKQTYPGGGAGPGFYTCTITVKKGEKTIIIEEDSDNDISYRVKISDGLDPDKARYRGWSSNDKKYGYEPSGGLYRPENERGYPLDATVSLDYSTSFVYPSLVLWEPAGGEKNSGRYWQVFNNNAGSNSNLFGFFQGKPSRLIGAKFSGVQLELVSKDKSPDKKAFADIRVYIERRGPDNSWFPRKRFQWVAFISRKSDVLEPEKQQPIADELNKISGLGAVITNYRQKPVKIIPAFYKGAIYMPAAQISVLCNKIKTDEAFYKALCIHDSRTKPVFDAWRFPDSAKALVKEMIDIGNHLQQVYETGEGTYSFRNRYWMGTLNFKNYALFTSCIFADKSIELTDKEKRGLEQLIAMLGRIVWDDNNVPMFEGSGVNFGPANMAFQYRNNGRMFFALLLAQDPEFSERARQAAVKVNEDINISVYANGASFGSPHYTQATLDPILFSMLQLKQAGVADLFRTNPKIKKFAEFYSTLITPPSVRFGLNRKLISFGDGSEESAATFALLAEGLKEVDPSLSARLFHIFNNGPQRFTLSGPVSLAADIIHSPDSEFNATTSNYNGYVSHFRYGQNSDNETAIWVLNGDSLYDHRNDDAGEIAIYALKAPLSLSRSCFYYPSATDARIRSVVIPEKIFPEWNQQSQPINERSLSNRTWPASYEKSFANTGYSSTTAVVMKNNEGEVWTRRISLLHYNKDLPIIIFYDSISGKGANIWSMMMMSDSAVQTPAGAITPPKRVYNNANAKELPAATPQKTLNKGLNTFMFNGQFWLAHPTKGINWNLYTVSDSQMDFTLAQWTNTWQNDIETAEFLRTNKKRYSEEQQILRMRSNEPFFNFILPYNKGIAPYNKEDVSYRGNKVISLRQNDINLVFNPFFYGLKDNRKIVLGVFSEIGNAEFEGFSISGGFAELESDLNTVKVRIHGNSGVRSIRLPFEVALDSNQKGIKLRNDGKGKTILQIQYDSVGLDLPNGQTGYSEFRFTKR